MASLPQIEQYLAANPELAARIKQQMEEAMAAVLAKPTNLNSSGAASSAAVLRAQEMLSMLSQQSLAALTQNSMQLLNQQQDQHQQQQQQQSRHQSHQSSHRDRDRERAEQQRQQQQLLEQQQRVAAAQQLLNSSNGSASAIREVGLPSTPLMAQQQVSQSQQLAAEQLTANSLAEPLGNGIYLATSAHIQQGFASQAPPTLIVPPTHIPLYPGYPQVPGGPGFVSGPSMTKYTQLLAVIEEMSKDLRPTYSGSKTAQDRFKRGIAQARILLRECMHETNQSNGSSRN